jgi:hypothetical protein
MRIIKAGATSQSIYVEILDSASTTGGRKTGIVFNAAGLTAYYVRNGGSATAITLATLAAANSAYSSGGFKEVDATNTPGVYRLDVPDAAIAAGAPSVVITIKGASGAVQVSEEIQLTTVDMQDSVRAGMTALPNAAAEAAGGLYTRGTGAGQIKQTNNGEIDSNTTRINNVVTTSVTTISAVIGHAQALVFNANNFLKVSLNDILATTLTETSGQIAGGFKKFFNIAAPAATMDHLILVDTATALTTNNDKTGYGLSAAAVQAIWDALSAALTTANSIGKRIVDFLTGDIYARLGAPAGASVSVDVAAIKTETASIQADTNDIQARLPAALTADGNIKADTLRVGGTLQTAGDIIGDTNDIQSRLPAALSGNGNLKADVLEISDDITAADRLEALMDGILVVQVNGVATTTSIPIDGFTSVRNDQFKGRLVTVISDGSYEQTAISAYSHATQTLTVTALTAAPADNVFLVIH